MSLSDWEQDGKKRKKNDEKGQLQKIYVSRVSFWVWYPLSYEDVMIVMFFFSTVALFVPVQQDWLDNHWVACFEVLEYMTWKKRNWQALMAYIEADSCGLFLESQPIYIQISWFQCQWHVLGWNADTVDTEKLKGKPPTGTGQYESLWSYVLLHY